MQNTNSKSPLTIHVKTNPIKQEQTVVMDYTIFAAFRHWVEENSDQQDQPIIFDFEIVHE